MTPNLEVRYWIAFSNLARVYRGERPYTEAVHYQITKLMEEVGETAQAFIGYSGQNPRKGHTHSMGDVADEVCDVIVTGMVLLSTIMEGSAEAVFKGRIDGIMNRARKDGLFNAS